jgi:hypothetical protein
VDASQTQPLAKMTPNIAEKKKPYQAPRLIIYGDLTQLTQGTGMRTLMMDASGAMNMKT